ncbi:MAG TPA: SSI family serine proteinase inhibitor [Streptosporangiaceae bacterium]|nr:SSI family serine proteinase inhibitor [Streptosporangiaceae bacterium]
MAVINLRTRARFTPRPFARPAAASGGSFARNDGSRRPGHMLLTAVVGVIAAAGVLAGCGTAAAPGAGGAGSAGSHRAAKATLTIKVTDRAAGKVTHWSLRCDPPGGTTPDPAAACKALFGHKNTLIPLRRHTMIMCPMILVSGKQIIVDGTWFGKKVHRVLIDGECDLPIFNSLAKIFR